MLQWGRVMRDAEIRQQHIRRQPQQYASMGPRHERRGNAEYTKAADAERLASMGPRHERRGNQHKPRGTGRTVMLQWGRVMRDAEIPVPRPHTRIVAELQWGRVMRDAEIGGLDGGEVTVTLLQWGRVMRDAEMQDSRHL